MSEFKFACPVCGQHMSCDETHSGLVMECPTCFQQITAPQAPTTDDPKFILTGTKVGERPAPTVAEGATPVLEKHLPAQVFIWAAVACVVVVAGFVIWAVVSKSSGKSGSGANQPAWKKKTATKMRGLVVSGGSTNDSIWTLDFEGVTIPDQPVEGSIHGRPLNPQVMIVNGDGLTIRNSEVPPEAGFTIYLRQKRETLYGKTIEFNPDSVNTPAVNLRWKDAQGQAQEHPEHKYALRIVFGQPDGNHLPGKIYLCTEDDDRSYARGTFNAELR